MERFDEGYYDEEERPSSRSRPSKASSFFHSKLGLIALAIFVALLISLMYVYDESFDFNGIQFECCFDFCSFQEFIITSTKEYHL